MRTRLCMTRVSTLGPGYQADHWLGQEAFRGAKHQHCHQLQHNAQIHSSAIPGPITDCWQQASIPLHTMSGHTCPLLHPMPGQMHRCCICLRCHASVRLQQQAISMMSDVCCALHCAFSLLIVLSTEHELNIWNKNADN